MTTTREDLDAKLAEACEAVTEAERELGVATLDSKGEAAARKALETARSEKTGTENAIEELERREAEAAREQAEGAARDERVGIYEWAKNHLPKVAAVIEARAALERAEAEAKATPAPARVRRLKDQGVEKVTEIKPDGTRFTTKRTLAETDDLDFPLIANTQAPGLKRIAPEGLTVERCRELVERAEMLIAAEREGKGREVTVTGKQRATERAEQRNAQREANREAKRKAEEEAEAAAEAERAERERKAKQPETKQERRERLAAEHRSNALNPVGAGHE